MHMLAPGDRSHHFADVDAVLDDRVALAVVTQRELMADGNVVLRHDFEVLVLFHDPAVDMLPGLHAFHDDDADAVALLVHHEMNHALPAKTKGLFYSHARPPPLPAVARRAGFACWRAGARTGQCQAALQRESVLARHRVRLSATRRLRLVDAARTRAARPRQRHGGGSHSRRLGRRPRRAHEAAPTLPHPLRLAGMDPQPPRGGCQAQAMTG